ncbi:MAG: Ig-like domain-containing protein [Opitutaceae bacterium]
MKEQSTKLNNFKILGTACLASLAIGTAQAADITWDPPVAIAAATDISTTGALVEAVNPTKTSTVSPVVNGVTFNASIQGAVMSNAADSADFFTPDTGNTDYNSLLQSFSWGSNELYPGVGVGSGNLISGQQYLIQLWYSDMRTNDHGSNEVTYGDGNSNLSAPLNEQLITGYFTADGGYQTITASRYNPITDTTGTGYCNAYQIRQLSSFPVPTLSTASNSVSGNFSVNIDFSEAVTGLEESDFSVINGTVQTSSLTGSGANWSVIIVPTASGDVSVTLPAVSVIDGESESNLESNILVTTYVAPGSAQPIATLSTPLDKVSVAYTVHITFTEAVTGLELSDFIISNGTLSDLSGSGASYSVLVTPISQGDVTLSLPAGSVTDTDGDNLQNPTSNELVRDYGRANWLRGAWGINWKPVDLYNGGHEGLSIEPFLDQISDLRTVDYLQIHLGESSIKSSVHMGPHDLLESFWQGDTDVNGDPLNLVVPRASFGEDPFLEIIKATRAAGMRVQVYVNSSNMLSRDGPGGSNPSYIPNITERWKAWCDTDPDAQAFIASQSYHTMAGFPERPYMFCYAEFVLKVYAIRYGDLIDGWCFDSGRWMVDNGDNATNGVAADQLLYQAFADACQAGNPHAAISFQNSPERDTEELNPFSEAVHADDYMFGHPYNGGKDGGSHIIGDPPLYDRNYAHIQKITETNGNVHAGIDPQVWTWDDKVVGHYDPPMSTTSWNGGNTAALTDAEFNLWNLEAMQGGGAISWGLPLVSKSGTNEQLVAKAWALAQLTQMDAHLRELESPGTPNWARAYTVLPDAAISTPYSHTLVENTDFWDPEEDAVTLSLGAGAPSWLTLAEDPSNPGSWLLEGVPTETTETEYEFGLLAADATSGATERIVHLTVEGIPVNIALAGVATQSSTDFDGEAPRAIDGDTNGSYGQDSVTHTTDEAQPWWRVDLGTAYAIDEIIIWNRSGSTSIRLIDFDVFILDGGDSIVWSNYQANSPDPSVSLLPAGITGQHVMVQLRGTEALSLAEVQVFGSLASDQALWRFDNFGIYDNTGIAADTYDTDFDGNLNLIEYATGTDPNTPGPSPFTIQSDGGSGFEVVFDRILNPALNYFVEGTSILPATSWDPIWSESGTSAGTVTVPDTLWPSGHNEYFLRLRISY